MIKPPDERCVGCGSTLLVDGTCAYCRPKPLPCASCAAKDARILELERVIRLVFQRWTFSEDQQHTHTWHDMEDCRSALVRAVGLDEARNILGERTRR